MTVREDPGAVVIRRPRSHITAPRNWLNDPNGLIKHGDTYHVFYQYNPDAPVWGPPLWGHASSTDLVHWTDHEPALRPRPAGSDRDGCWSGCARVIDGRPTIFYTGVVAIDGVRTESVCVAHGSDDLRMWTQAEQPLIAAAPPEITTGVHRDPFIFGEPGAWRMLLGSSLVDAAGRASGAVLGYRSEDLVSWAYDGVLFQRPSGLGPIDTGPLWECPQVVRQGDDDILIFSVNVEGQPDALRYSVFAVGTLTDIAFEPRAMGRLDHGDVFYAPAIMVGDPSRVLLWGWIQERHDRLDVDHNGALSLPRVVELREGRMRVAPAPELLALRTTTVTAGEIGDGGQGRAVSLAKVLGPAEGFELEASIVQGARVALDLGADGLSIYRLTLDEVAGIATVESGGSGPFQAPLPPLPEGARRHVRLFVDGSVMELFIDDEVAVTTRCYRARPTTLHVIGEGALLHVVLHGLDVAFAGREA